MTLTVDGGNLTITPADVELVQQTRSGWGIASDGAVTVALDVDLDASPGLRREGMVREVIHHIQNLRRSSGLQVADRIELEIATDRAERLAYALTTHASLIAGEVLATSVEIVDLDSGPDADEWEGTVLVEIDGVPIRISVRRS